MPRDAGAPPLSEWLTAAELAELALPDIPTTKRGVNDLAKRQGWQRPDREGTHWRQRQGRGGGIEYHLRCLPMLAKCRAAWLISASEATPAAPEPGVDRGDWDWFTRQTDERRARAEVRHHALTTVERSVMAGERRVIAMQIAAAEAGVRLSTIYEWKKLVHGLPETAWMVALTPRQAGGRPRAECSPEAWAALKADYLRREQPNFTDCYERLAATAAAQGWHIPSADTLHRRLMAIPEQVRVLEREGAEALKRLFPAQQRDRGVFHALEAVNADAHTWDVFVRWPDGSVGRPVMVAFQDLYSGKVLSWRVDRSVSWHSVRLAFGDMVERYGIPRACWLDNGREFAAKKITGGQPNRYRFKLREEEPQGLMTTLGVEVHWTTPYHGQAKPIERAFRDFAQSAAKHPAFAGAYTGNNPMAKPENYGSKAVPLDEFLRVAAQAVVLHNARPGRRSPTCAGRSFDETFEASYATAMIRKAAPEQRRLWLLAAEGVRVRQQDGTIHFHGNRYWAEFLLGYRGKQVMIRFDPEALAEPLHVFAADGRFVGMAECVAAVGFDSVDDARAHTRTIKQFQRATKLSDELRDRMDLAEYARLLPKLEAPEPPAPRVVQLVRGATALKPAAAPEAEADGQARVLAAMAKVRAERRGLRVIEELEDEPE